MYSTKLFLIGKRTLSIDYITFHFENVVYHFVDEECLGIICQTIMDFFADTFGGDYIGLTQDFQMMADGRCAHIHRFGNVVDAFFAMAQEPEYA